MGKNTRNRQLKEKEKEEKIISYLKDDKADRKYKKKKKSFKKNMDGQDFFHLFVPTYTQDLISAFGSRAIRRIADWKPVKKSMTTNTIDLINHLFVRYKYPHFFTNMFFQKNENNRIYFNWFLTISRGDSLYKLNFKHYNLSKKETYYFLTAPDIIKQPDDAVLYAIVKANTTANDFIKYYSLFRKRKNYPSSFFYNDFYKKAFVFLCKQDFEDLKECYDEVSDYLFVSNIRNENFEFKNRTLNSIKNLSNIWHTEAARLKSSGSFEWNPLIVSSSRIWKSEKDPNWSCVELLNSKELCNEGRRMHHCVASYARFCAQGSTHIFSFYNNEESERCTVEVRTESSSIVQCRGRFNTRPSKSAKEVVKEWARSHSIHYQNSVF